LITNVQPTISFWIEDRVESSKSRHTLPSRQNGGQLFLNGLGGYNVQEEEHIHQGEEKNIKQLPVSGRDQRNNIPKTFSYFHASACPHAPVRKLRKRPFLLGSKMEGVPPLTFRHRGVSFNIFSLLIQHEKNQ